MLGFLFRGLTAEADRAAALFDTLTKEARRPDWYRAGAVPDTFNGRFSVLATVTALALIRLEQDVAAGCALSVTLTERFIQVMESEHRELGISDPSLGKTVRKLVAMLERRVELWRSTTEGGGDWSEAVRASLYGDTKVGSKALEVSAALAIGLLERLKATAVDDLEQGKLA
jgi:cytochrome b pre-mRNA-processing protein 3